MLLPVCKTDFNCWYEEAPFSYTRTHVNTVCIDGGILSEELGKFSRFGTFHVSMNPNQSSIELVSPNSLILRNCVQS